MDIKILGGGAALLLIIAMVFGALSATNAIQNPASPVKAPSISFSSGGASEASATLDMDSLNKQVEVLLVAVPDSSLTAAINPNSESEGELTDASTKAKAKWSVIVKDGRCRGSLNTTHQVYKDSKWNEVEIEENLNNSDPNGSMSCTEWDVMEMFVRWLHTAIEARVSPAEILFVIKVVYDQLAFKLDMSITTEMFMQLLNLH